MEREQLHPSRDHLLLILAAAAAGFMAAAARRLLALAAQAVAAVALPIPVAHKGLLVQVADRLAPLVVLVVRAVPTQVAAAAVAADSQPRLFTCLAGLAAPV